MDMGFTSGPMKVSIKEIGITTKYLDMGNISGMMGAHLMDTGLIIICMDKVSINGLMEECMKVNTLMIKKMAMVFTHIQTEDHIRDIGKMENNMVKVYLLILMGVKSKEYGREVNEYNGLMIMNKIKIWINE